MAGNDAKPPVCQVEKTGEPCELAEGIQCFLYVAERHFLVRVLALDNDTVCVTFPGKDYPIEGMHADMEFHDEDGYCYYSTEVLRGPVAGEEGIVLRRPAEVKRSVHRSTYRIPTDLTVQVKDRDHVRRYNASLQNISAGGALIQSDAPFDFSTTVEMDLSLPGESTHTIPCQVAQILSPGNPQDGHVRLLCLRFTELAVDADLSITHYIWRHLQELYNQS
ncbi:MAG: PilZ domain-containing protein [Candidatus Hydrogenedentes bacterium]|nr:PilZ domain-containing protein [Candidatus Hydrogenedentota bacterium]